jgi:hypothetical protein
MNRAAVVGWGTMLNVMHLVKGVRVLHGAACCHAAIPVLRSIMEYALGTIWLADAGDGAVDVFNRRFQYAQGKLRKAVGDTNLDGRFPADVVKHFRDTLGVDLPTHPDERLASFTNLMAEYGAEEMVAVYHVLSGIAHLSLEGAQTFFKEKGNTVQVWREPYRGELMPCEQICLQMEFAAMLAYNELLNGKPWTAALAEIGKDHGLSLTLTVRKSTRTSQ